jgi:hypothetical protein
MAPGESGLADQRNVVGDGAASGLNEDDDEFYTRMLWTASGKVLHWHRQYDA